MRRQRRRGRRRRRRGREEGGEEGQEEAGGLNLPARIVSSSGEAPDAALPLLPVLRASVHGPRGEDGAGRRPEESGGCPRAPRSREPFPLRLLLLLHLTPGCEQLAALLRLLVPGPLRPGVPVQVLRQDLLLLGSLCQLHLRLRPGLGGRPVPTLPGQVQVNRTFWIFNRWTNKL